MARNYRLAFAQRDICNHAKALHELGFINWTMHLTKFDIGDIVYLFMSDERRLRFKTVVVAKDCPRKDGLYWEDQNKIDSYKTYKLQLVEEYSGKGLEEAELKKHGFNGGGSIEKPLKNNPQLFEYINGFFKKKIDYGYIIDELCPSEKSVGHVRTIMPILVRWAKQGLTDKTYNDLIKELGLGRFSGIGKQLGYVSDVIEELKKLTGENIPTLNALVKSDKSHLPSEGFSYVSEDYANMTLEDKKTYVMGLNAKAIQYNKWDWVLASLGLTPSTIIEDIEIIREKIKKGYKSGGESPYHKNLKEYICNHPKIVGIKDEAITKNETEHQLLSGDKLDVYFETYDGSKIAVEVKSRISDDLDITRGLFQCIKYQSILDAESRANSEEPKNSVFLVLEGQLSVNNRRIRDVFDINVIENVIIE
ncbi:hypothetical protein [uncultured Prevotella sp.]|uniref:hypothetical protein n=1 Tax=uncultured Prevotella sp. TaxID=159272 RepID=UPI0025874AEA|nr:hypothetical protein [uncultured Prevotella sp.]